MTNAVYRSATCNVLHTNSASLRTSTIKTAWSNADVCKFNEAGGSASIIRSLSDVATYMPANSIGDNNPIAWRKSVFTLVKSGYRSCWPGKAGMSPARGITWVLLKHRTTGQYVLEFNMHQIHQAFTRHPERRSIWTQVITGAAAEIRQTMSENPNVKAAVISGDMNRDPDRDGEIDFSDVADTRVKPSPDTYGSLKYDQFFLIGGVSVAAAARAINTASDHHTLVVGIKIIQNNAPASKPAPTSPVVADTPTPRPASAQPTVPATVSRKLNTYRKKPNWRYFAIRMDGSGGDGALIHPNLPLQGAEIEDVLTGHNALSGSVSPQMMSLIADDGSPVLTEWGTAIFAEESGTIHGGGILTDISFERSEMSLECVGFTGYADGLPYNAEKFYVETDPAFIFRDVWKHIQSQVGGNVGLDVDSIATGVKIGTALNQGEFDTVSGPLTFESGPYKLAWYQDHDLGDNLANLAADTPFDWHESHYWDGDVLKHRLRLGAPKIGVRRDDLRFVFGENIHVIPSVDRAGDEYADEVWYLGSGEGSLMKRGTARANIDRLRRVSVTADPSLQTQQAVTSAALRDIKWRTMTDTVSEVQVIDHPHADIASVAVGDEIHVQGRTGWVDIDAWYRVLSRKITPNSADKMSLTIMRSDKAT